tara:strand:+ start:294 stop:701 length:408 start_codon:yes stop_codon:yes gene_type:complete
MISALVSSILPVASTVIDRLVPDKNAAGKAKREMEKALVDAEAAGRLGQLEINKVEAAHRSIFVAGWRPFIGWCCGAALAYHFVLQPIIVFGLALTETAVPALPAFDMDSLMTVLLGMLGLGGMRSFEKFKGLAK